MVEFELAYDHLQTLGHLLEGLSGGGDLFDLGAHFFGRGADFLDGGAGLLADLGDGAVQAGSGVLCAQDDPGLLAGAVGGC